MSVMPWIAGNGPFLDKIDVTFSLNELIEDARETGNSRAERNRVVT